MIKGMKMIFCGIWLNYSKKNVRKKCFSKFQLNYAKMRKNTKMRKMLKMRKIVKNAIMHAKTRSHFSKVSNDDDRKCREMSINKFE